LVLFVRIGTFQWVTSKKIKKIDSRLKLCAKRLRQSLPSFLRLRPGEAWGRSLVEFFIIEDDSLRFCFAQGNVGISSDRRKLLSRRNSQGGLWNDAASRPSWLKEPRRARRLEAWSGSRRPSCGLDSSFEAASRRLRTRWFGSLPQSPTLAKSTDNAEGARQIVRSNRVAGAHVNSDVRQA
jgi:hypothetical protein